VSRSDHFKLRDYAFSDFELNDDETIQASLRMFLDLDILDLFHISSKVRLLFLQSVCSDSPHLFTDIMGWIILQKL
jgi:hypothetical protein